jgi:MoaA/NifB/PqqE/SkfB family radical SAM enzyme
MRQLGLLRKTINNIDVNIARVFIPWAVKNPRYLRSFYRLKKTYNSSTKVRKIKREEGIRIPPFLILSVTSECNLNCIGCYASAVGTTSCPSNIKTGSSNQSLTWDQWYDIIRQGCNLGIFGFVIAGGEPLLYPRCLEFCKEFKDRFFIIFTNGTILNDIDYKLLKKLGNVAVIVSIEGDKKITDLRRSRGVYDKAMNSLVQLNKIGVINGISVTITRNNYRYWMDEKPIDDLINKGIRVGVFIEHIPTSKKIDDLSLMLEEKERQMFREKMLYYRENKSIYIVHSPGDEEYFGGCVSAGRGFAHITPTGDLTPCPISNIATHNLTRTSLYEGLQSKLFQIIRENEQLLETKGMPCALFAHAKEVDLLAKKVGAYRTNEE